ncbi:MAG: MAE_28990/MAE_18760 family HEPN-like nuclease [Candidatus Methanoperedens sp.]|nr:MAE_28990/MAE_18760 family HEPN-like nuclease [Candidatus Methanoperedens sp.]
MKAFISEFYTRIDEINEYFIFIAFIDCIETHKKEKITIGTSCEFIPKRDLQKILRSNCFLLLYNLVESSVRNGILSVYDSIEDDSLKYEELSEKIQEIWLTHQTSKKDIKKRLKQLMKDVSEGCQIVLEKDTINISGNLDYDSIQKIINTFGFFGRFTVDEKHIKSALDKVKHERNLLAHGNKTFCQSGEIITMSELTNIKDNISKYLGEFLLNIETYIDNKRYKKIK